MSIVAVTGCSGHIGERLLYQLEDDPQAERIIGIDIKPPKGKHKKLEFHKMDIRDPEVTSLFQSRHVSQVVHLAFVLESIRDTKLEYDIDISGLNNILRATLLCQADHLIVASSTTAFGAFPDNPSYLAENDIPRKMRSNSPYAKLKYELERIVNRFRLENSNIGVAIVRPCIVLGPNVNNINSRRLLSPIYITISGAKPDAQFVHEDDVAAVFRKVFDRKAKGNFHSIGKGLVSVDDLCSITGKRIINITDKLIYPVTDLLWKMRINTSGPSGMIDYVRYRWIVSDNITRQALDFRPQYSSREVLEMLMKSHKK